MGLTFKRLTLFAVLVLTLAYPAARLGVFNWPSQYDPLALPDLSATPGFLTQWQMKLVDMSPKDCALTLSQADVDAPLLPDDDVGSDCPRLGWVTLTRLSKAVVRNVKTRCAIAARLYLWERHTLQPLAQKMFGEAVIEIGHMGSFSCRNMRNGTSLSEHATANAIDIMGFRLASGKFILLKNHWNGGDVKAEFLRKARDGLCDNFNTTLSPDYNADHADHFHADMGWWQSCR